MAADGKCLRIPPGPKGVPLIGQLLEFQRDPLAFLQQLATQYGGIARFHLGWRNCVQIGEPDLIQEVLVTNHRNFRKTGFLERARPVLGNGLVTAEGAFHLRQRRLIQPAFSKHRSEDYAGSIVDLAMHHGEQWCDGQSVDMFREMLHLTLKIVTRTLFSTSSELDIERIERALTTVLEHITWLLSPLARVCASLPIPANRRFRESLRVLDSIVFEMIAARRNSGDEQADVLSMLLRVRDPADGTGMSDNQIRDEVMTLFTAGHETVATALTWTWYALATHPEVYERLVEELDNVLGDRPPTAERVPSLVYVEMVFAEAMRLYPPVWAITRTAIEDCELGGFEVPAGSLVGMSQYVVHRDARFFPEPERFDPNRWTQEGRSSRPRYSYFPFGGGPRLCIGEPFAWLEGVLVLATLCQQWRPIVPVEHSAMFHPTITLRPRHGLPMKLVSRRNVARCQPAADCIDL
jgi:cytochrome P450